MFIKYDENQNTVINLINSTGTINAQIRPYIYIILNRYDHLYIRVICKDKKPHKHDSLRI